MWETEGEKRVPHSEKHPHGEEISWDKKGPLGDRRRMQWTAYGRQYKSRTVHIVCVAALKQPGLNCVSSIEEGVMENGVLSMDPGRGQLLVAKDNLKWQGFHNWEILQKKIPGYSRSNASLLSGVQGVGLLLQFPFTTHLRKFTHPSSQNHLHCIDSRSWKPPMPKPPWESVWAPLFEMGIQQCWQRLNAKAWG